MRKLSIRIVVAAVIIAIHVLLVVAFVPFVRIEIPAFSVTEVSLGLPDSAEAGSRAAPPPHDTPEER
jgi:hypothetical protein